MPYYAPASLRRPLMLGGLVFLACVGSFQCVRERVADRRWASFHEELAEFEQSLTRTPGPLDVPWQETLQGFAAEHYEAAFDRIGTVDLAELQRVAVAKDDEGRERRRQLLEEGRDVLALLARAAQTERLAWTIDPPPDEGRAANDAEEGASRKLAFLLLLAAACDEFDAGRHRAGCDRIVQGLQLVRDVLHGPSTDDELSALQLLGLSAWTTFLQSQRLASLDGDSRGRLRGCLERLNAGLLLDTPALARDLAREYAALADFVEEGGSRSWVIHREWTSGLQNLWSDRVAVADRFRVVREWVRAAREERSEGLVVPDRSYGHGGRIFVDHGGWVDSFAPVALEHKVATRAFALLQIRLLAAALAVLDGDEPGTRAALLEPALVERVKIELLDGALRFTVPGTTPSYFELIVGTFGPAPGPESGRSVEDPPPTGRPTGAIER